MQFMARTTVELSEDNIVWLRTEAAKRGARGYSVIIDEAVRALASARRADPARAARVERLRGSVGKKEALALEGAVRASRAKWRAR